MDEATKAFVEAMVPILEQESNMVWGPKGVGRIVRWTCKESGSRIFRDVFLDECKMMSANCLVLQRALNRLMGDGLGATRLEVVDLAVKALGVSMPLQRLLDMIEPDTERGPIG